MAILPQFLKSQRCGIWCSELSGELTFEKFYKDGHAVYGATGALQLRLTPHMLAVTPHMLAVTPHMLAVATVPI